MWEQWSQTDSLEPWWGSSSCLSEKKFKKHCKCNGDHVKVNTVVQNESRKLDLVVMPVSIAIKPLLADQHKLQLVLLNTMDKVDASENKNKAFYDTVHIVDEK